jgi:hypothetical protein
MPRTTSSEPATLVAAARRDLEEVEAALSRGDDCLVALVILARAAKRADDAVFVLLDAHAVGTIESVVVDTHRGYALIKRRQRRSR